MDKDTNDNIEIINTLDNQINTRCRDNKLFFIALFILSVFALLMIIALWGSYILITNPNPIKDPGVVGMVSGFVGTIIGYAAANAQQVVGFFFGSSQSSANKSEDLSNVVDNLTRK